MGSKGLARQFVLLSLSHHAPMSVTVEWHIARQPVEANFVVARAPIETDKPQVVGDQLVSSD